MSDLIFNLRVGLVHIQVGRYWPWLRVSVNNFHRGKLGTESAWVEIY